MAISDPNFNDNFDYLINCLGTIYTFNGYIDDALMEFNLSNKDCERITRLVRQKFYEHRLNFLLMEYETTDNEILKQHILHEVNSKMRISKIKFFLLLQSKVTLSTTISKFS